MATKKSTPCPPISDGFKTYFAIDALINDRHNHTCAFCAHSKSPNTFCHH